MRSAARRVDPATRASVDRCRTIRGVPRIQAGVIFAILDGCVSSFVFRTFCSKENSMKDNSPRWPLWFIGPMASIPVPDSTGQCLLLHQSVMVRNGSDRVHQGDRRQGGANHLGTGGLARLKAEASNLKTDIWWGGTGDPFLAAAEQGLLNRIARRT